MPRIHATLPLLAFLVFLSPVSEAVAAGSGRAFAPAGPPSFAPRMAPGFRHLARQNGPFFRHDRARRFLGNPGFIGGPWYSPSDFGRDTVILQERESERTIDRSRDYTPVMVGIPQPPTPEPVIYRLEGSRQRPIVRIIRIGEQRSYARDDDGARIRNVPRR
ncbi:hypothetical protein [Bosea sp. BIWAKO-01]|uniref:hypothetical protein n=1 Tax=Bosea sp. BIWAKO-01 TaxID=506668 RepID=UPI00086C0445|nr:hypothetical protein [Bosea sp. BIWAKO-01]GAU84146.1 hypothetical protein BIWAKO_04077 [Bosea sp. BIWAKO-01]